MDPALQLADFFLLFFYAMAHEAVSIADALHFVARHVSADELARIISALDEIAAGLHDQALLDEVMRQAASRVGLLVEGNFREVAAQVRDILAATRTRAL